jgi:hypothetical protein
VVTIRRLIVGNVLFRRLRLGLLGWGIASLLVFAGMAPANAATLTQTGDGMTFTVVSAHLVNKVAVNVNVAVTCSLTNFGTGADDPANRYFVIAGFTLSENVKGTLVSYQGNRGANGDWPYVNCDGTPQTFTIQVLPSGPGAYKAGPAYVSNGQGGVFDSDASCGQLTGFNFAAPCDTVSFSGGVQITG